MSEENIIARPYARAVFETAVSMQQIQAWHDYLSVLVAIVQDKQVVNLVKSPDVTDLQVAEEMIQVVEKLERTVDQTMKNFVYLLAENHRLLCLLNILQLFDKQRADYENTIEVMITSSLPVTDIQKQNFSKSLEKRFEKKASITFDTDPSLLGGAIIRAGDYVIDGSIREKLQRLTQHLNIKEQLWK